MTSEAPPTIPPADLNTDAWIGRGARSKLGRTIVRGSSWLIGGRVARTIVTITGMVVLARLLTPNDFGVLALGTAATALSLVLLEGEIDYPAIRADDLTIETLRQLIWSGLLSMTIFGLGLWLLAPLAEEYLNFPHLAFTLRAMIPICLSQVFFVAGLGILRRHHRFATASIVALLTVVLYMAISVLLVSMGYGIYGVIAGMVLANVATAAALAALARLPILPPRNAGHIVSHFRLGGYGALGRFFAWGYTNVDTVIVGWVLGPYAAGIYSRAYNINVQAKEPFLALDQTMRQVFASAKGSKSDLGTHLLSALRVITVLSSISAAALIIFRHEIVFVLLGPQWQGIATPLAILAVALPVRVARMYFDGLSVILGDLKGLAYRQMALFGLTVIGLVALTHYGLAGAAVATALPLYIGLLFALGKEEYAVIGSFKSILLAILPGILIGAALVALNYAIAGYVSPASWSHDLLLRLAIYLLSLTSLLFAPSIVIGARFAKYRRDLISYFSGYSVNAGPKKPDQEPKARPARIALITKTVTQNQGNQALSIAWYEFLKKQFGDVPIQLVERSPAYHKRYTLGRFSRHAQPLLLLDRIAGDLNSLRNSDAEALLAAKTSIVHNPNIRQAVRFKRLRRALKINSKLSRFLIGRASFAARLGQMLNSSLVVVNPAGEFQRDATDTAISYLLDLRCAQLAGCKTALVNLSFEVEDETVKRLSVHVMDQCDIIAFRDTQSLDHYKAAGGTRDPHVFPDGVIMTPSYVGPRDNPKGLAVAINALQVEWSGYGKDWDTLISDFTAAGYSPTLTSNEWSTDFPFWSKYIDQFGMEAVGRTLDYTQYIALLSKFECVISSRLHTCVFALLAGTPVVPVETGTFKLSGFFEQIGLGHMPIIMGSEGWRDQIHASVKIALEDPQPGLAAQEQAVRTSRSAMLEGFASEFSRISIGPVEAS